MDLDKMLKNVSNLNDYISITQEIVNYTHNNTKIQFNMSSVLLLKKVRSLEIEYFNKCEGNGAALVLFGRMVEQPPSKTWGLLGKELVALLQYWLDAMRKHLIKHSHHWWIFLKLLLKFIKSMRVKDNSLPDTLVEGTAECLLDLATSTEADTAQRQEILYCLNLCCAESSREIRFALRTRFENYFSKLATLMATCAHLPTQYSMLETLLRWLLPRHEASARQAAAARWFPTPVFGKKALQLFLERPWQNFFQDARDFLNAFNFTGNLVTSFLCRKITVGTVTVVSGTEKRETWLDLNSWDSSATVVLDPRLLDALCVPDAPTWESLRVPAHDTTTLQLATVVLDPRLLDALCVPDAPTWESLRVPAHDTTTLQLSATVVLDPRLLDALCVPDAPTWESLRVPAHDTTTLQLCREASQVTLVIHTTRPPQLCPSDAVISEGCEVRVAFSSATDLRRLDRALREVFTHKYQVLLDLDKPTSLSPQERNENKKFNSSLEEDTRFSHPVEVQKRKRSGYMVRSRHPAAWKSPSTASTTSLAQLHEKLASLPQYKFDKEAVHVCALPELSTVTEVSESDDRQSLLSNSTFKINRPFGVCHRSNKSSDRNSQSDGEVHNKPKVTRYLSPAAKDEDNSTSCLLVATIGSADESIINDTLERLNKNKDFQPDNIVDLLVQEALQKDFNDKDLRDSGINTGDNRKTQEPAETYSEAIENTPIEKLNADLVQNKEVNAKACTVISNTTTDESNDVVYDTPLNFVNVRKRNAKTRVPQKHVVQKPNEGQIFDVKEVEKFFSQHISENNRGEIVISPTLARKINETSSESSEQFEDCLIIHEENNLNVEQIDVYDIDIIECLNSIVDKVCSDFDKCTELMSRDTTALELINIADNITEDNTKENVLPLKDVSNIEKMPTEDQNENVESKQTNTKPNKSIKLKFNTKRTVKSRANAKKKKNKLELEPAFNMSPIKEVNDTVVPATTVKTPESRKSPSNESVELGSALSKRKRKLYSPKDEGDDERVMQVTELDDDKDFKTSRVQTPKYKATSYKDIEMDRQKRLRQPRRKSKAKSESSPSPRTKKMDDIFNQLKENVEGTEPVKVVDKKTLEKDLGMYNFTSDSEDEDFKRKKIEIQKRISSTTIASGDSIMSTRHGRSINRVNYSETKSSDEASKKKTPKPKRTVKRKKAQPKSRVSKPVKTVTPLIDEKMRDAIPEELNTSIVVDKPPEEIPGEPKLMLPVKPQMEPLPDETVTEAVKESHEKPKKTTRKNKKTDALSLRKEKNDQLNRLNIERDNDDRTTSPLPGLIVESMPAHNDDANDSVSANMLQKFKKIYQDGPEAYINESNTTQNLLSDVERINYSPLPMNITDELNQAGNYSKLSDVSNEITEIPDKSLQKKTNRKGIVIDLSDTCNPKTDSAKLLKIKKEKGVEMKKKSLNTTPELINLTKISDDKSEVSIATVGKSPITAHGDSDEHPPNSELLTENIRPRDLDIEYMDQSMKDYFDRLRAEVNEVQSNGTGKESIDSDSTRVLNNDDRRSPVVSVARLSIEDISKWLPSRRNSDTDSSSLNSPSKEVLKQNHTLNVNVKDNSDQESDNDNSPVQKIDKISLQFDFGNKKGKTNKKQKTKKALDTEEIAFILSNDDPDKCNKLEEDESKKRSRKQAKKTKNANLEDAKTVKSSKWLRSRNQRDETESNTKSISPPIKNATPKKTRNVQASQENRKSLISPIKLFDDFKVSKDESSSSTTVKKIGSINTNLDDELKHDLDKPSYSKSKKKETSSPASKICSSTKEEANVSRMKRKSKSPVIGNVKRRKVEEAMVSISDSGPSVSSVNEWFRRNAPMNRAVNVHASFRESIENVMEKLDTTLVEIHQNTSKKFIHMFVDAQKQLNSLKQERRNMYKTVASDILAQVVKVMDEKFADLDKRSREMDAEFMEQLKVQASALIREDCKKKQAMVSLLREDLNATLARMDRKGRGDTL
ncbi:hypothetical protein ABMA28_009271 [Loxostege sticticalis]|uniref:Telomere-associated protein RIF1 n=1 Tax=Loxostege sticticalis TaxID=481309 RepID=A0ABD0SEW8_LOXSC